MRCLKPARGIMVARDHDGIHFRPRGMEAWQEHDALIQAIGDGDADRAEQLMRAHTERTTEFYREEFVPANQVPSG